MPALRLLTLMLAASALCACATMPTPRNLVAAQYQSEQRLARYGYQNACIAQPALPDLAGFTEVDPATFASEPELLAPGDRLALMVTGDRDTLTGTYVIGPNGDLVIGTEVRISTTNRPRDQVQQALRHELLALGQIRDIPGNVRLQLQVATAVPVTVEGAVFEPGLVRPGERPPEAQSIVVGNGAGGDFNSARGLFTALRAAGGLRPDAAANMIYLVRGNRFARIDAIPAIEGGAVINPQLAEGDRIIVPTTGCFEPRLVRPSSVTTPGVRIYMSNLSRPAASNASSAIGKDSTSLPYGTRLLQGLISANCVGGSALNAERSAVLISRNPINGRSVVISRSVEGLVREANRDAYNPYLMPDDAIACYDSAAMSLVDVVDVFGSLLGPAVLVKGLGN